MVIIDNKYARKGLAASRNSIHRGKQIPLHSCTNFKNIALRRHQSGTQKINLSREKIKRRNQKQEIPVEYSMSKVTIKDN